MPSRAIVIEKPKAPDAPLGVCRWCGAPIQLAPDAHHSTRRRRYHRGDAAEASSPGDCLSRWLASRVWNPRTVIERRGDPACVDCGDAGEWQASFEVPEWAGGERVAANVVRRCPPCRRSKSAYDRARRKQLEAAGELGTRA